MILLVAGLFLIAVGLIAKFDRSMPSWLRGTIMAVVIVVIAGGVVLAIAVA